MIWVAMGYGVALGVVLALLVSMLWEHAHGRKCWLCHIDDRRKA